jgi:hypothetical protein
MKYAATYIPNLEKEVSHWNSMDDRQGFGDMFLFAMNQIEPCDACVISWRFGDPF